MQTSILSSKFCELYIWGSPWHAKSEQLSVITIVVLPKVSGGSGPLCLGFQATYHHIPGSTLKEKNLQHRGYLWSLLPKLQNSIPTSQCSNSTWASRDSWSANVTNWGGCWYWGMRSLFPQCINISQCCHFVMGPSSLVKPSTFSRTVERFSMSCAQHLKLNPA